MISLLAPIFSGPWAQYGETLVYDRTLPGLSIADLIADGDLRASILQRYARHLKCDDLRPAASLWMLHYFAVLFPPVVAAAALLNHVFPIDAKKVSVLLDEDAEPCVFYIPDIGVACDGANVYARYSGLVWEHVALLVEAFAESVPIARAILWGNAARRLEPIFDILIRQTDRISIIQDRDFLLRHERWPGRRYNPLYGRDRTALRSRDGQTVTVVLHRQCCLYYKVPPYDYCFACPIEPERRAARARAT